MKCPIDNTLLAIADRNGIEIDYCPQCRGVWLDRGELDKIIDRADNTAQQASFAESDNRVESIRNHHRPSPKKRESFLSDLFDFGD